MSYIDLGDRLNGEYKEAYNRAAAYCTMKGFEGGFAEERMAELYDILLSAMQDGKPARNIIGDDNEGFLRGFFSDYGIKERAASFAGALYRLAVLMLIFAVIDVIAADSPRDMLINGRFDCAAIFGGFGAGIVVNVISSIAFAPLVGKTKKANMWKWFLLVLVLLVGTVIVETNLLEKYRDKLSFISLGVLPAIIICAVYIMAFIGIRSVYRYKYFGTVRNVTKQLYKENSYKKLADDDLEKSVMKIWRKKGVKMLGKGKTEQDHQAWAEKVYRSNKKGPKYLIAVYTVIVVVFIVVTAMESTFWDTVFFAAFITAVEFFVGRFFVKGAVQGAAIQKRILDAANERGVTLLDYLNSELEEK